MPRVHSVYRKIGQIIFHNHISPKKVGKYMKRLIQQNRLYHTYNFKTRNRIIYELQLKYLVKNDGPGLHKINLLMLQTRLYIMCNPFTFNLSCSLKPLFHFWLFRVICLSVCHLYVYSLSITVWIVYIQSQPSRTLNSFPATPFSSGHSFFKYLGDLFSHFSSESAPYWLLCVYA